MNTYNVYHLQDTQTVVIGVVGADYYSVDDNGCLIFMQRVEEVKNYSKARHEAVATYKHWSGVQKVEQRTSQEATLFDEDRA